MLDRVFDGFEAAASGDHERADEILRPLFDDPRCWEVIATDPLMRTGVAYTLGIGDLHAGRLDRAEATFRRVKSDMPDHPEIRRGLAQVHMARGELDSAAKLLDPSPRAHWIDRVISAKLAWRRGDTDEAVRRALTELDGSLPPAGHPWDDAGALLQAGQILLDAGLVAEARRAVDGIGPLLVDAGPAVPIHTDWRILDAAVTRAEGRPSKALEVLAGIVPQGGFSLAAWHRERARSLRDLGRTEESAAEYREALARLEAAGERWDADALREEIAALGG